MSEQLLPKAEKQAQKTTLSRPVEIRIENLYKSFGSRRVLDGITLDVFRGEMIAIVGGSGSGKSTLLRHIIGLEQPDRGHVLVADHESPVSPLADLGTLDTAGMKRLQVHWAVVFQGNGLLAGRTVEYNIGLPLREVQGLDEPTIHSTVVEVTREVALDPDKDLDLTIDQLSGGMAKRVAIARALAQDPILLLYDEPTTGLDPQIAEQIHHLIASVHERETASGLARTSVIVTHDKAMLYRLCPRVVMLNAGRIVFDGTYEAFQKSDSPITRPYFDLMAELHFRPVGSSEIGRHQRA